MISGATKNDRERKSGPSRNNDMTQSKIVWATDKSQSKSSKIILRRKEYLQLEAKNGTKNMTSNRGLRILLVILVMKRFSFLLRAFFAVMFLKMVQLITLFKFQVVKAHFS